MSIEAPNNGIYTVLGEINLLLINLKKTNNKYSNYDHVIDPLSKNFYDLKNLLNEHSDLNEIDPSTFLAPFLEVIKSEETSGPITGMALTSVNKFISYGLIGINSETSSQCVQQIADSITHARFVGTDSSSDEVVLMKILNVLRTLMLSPIGFYLTNSSVCEIMQSCFQIFFENRLSELLRRTAEGMLVDMVQLLFARLPQYKDEIKFSSSIKKLTMKGDGSRQKKSKVKRVKQPTAETKSEENQQVLKESQDIPIQVQTEEQDVKANPTENEDDKNHTEQNLEASTEEKKNEFYLSDSVKSRKKSTSESSTSSNRIDQDESNIVSMSESSDVNEKKSEDEKKSELETTVTNEDSEYVNPRGVRFVQEGPSGVHAANIPYGLPCVRELLRFLISLINSRNSELMVSMGLNLITIGLESGIDHMASYQSLLAYIKDDLCKNLYNLLSSERLSIYTSVLRISFLLFESLRSNLKLQLEHFFIKLTEIITSESNRIAQEQKEVTIDFILQMLRLPGFAVEIYLNYDCSLNCTNLFEDLTKLLSKNAFSVQSLLTANSLSLSALLTIVENIELENSIKHSISDDRLSLFQSTLNSIRVPPSSGYVAASVKNPILSDSKNTNTYKPRDSNRKTRVNRMKVNTENLPTHEQLKSIRTKKRLIFQSIDLFNSSPSKSMQFLKDNNIFSQDGEIFMQQLITYLKETPSLDKKVIGDYLSNRKNIVILEKFIESFNFSNLRIDEALRLFLESFRLPGEAPLISNILEIFSRHWRKSNSEMFANDDAAFTLAYAIIMLNVDQHNHNVKKQSNPMIVDEFKKNLSRVNGGGNFDEKLLEEIYYAIKNDEIVMPAEHTGALRDNYLWKLLIRRGATSEALYIHAPAGSYNQEIFNIVWGQTISALSFVYDKSLELSVIQKTINGFRKCAQIAAHYVMSDVFDNIVISLCKFTALSNQSDSFDQISINFGMNNKAQIACKTVFQLVHNHGDILRDGWKNILDCIIQLYKAKLLPKVLIECEDYINPNGRIILIKEEVIPIIQKPEGSGLFSSFFPFMSSDLSLNKGPTPEEQEAIKNAKSCIEECHIEQLIHDTKFLRMDSLIELTKALIFASQINDIDTSANSTGLLPNSASLSGSLMSLNTIITSDNDAAVFSLEILIKVILQNRDRISCIWSTVRNHFYSIILNSSEYSFFLERTIVGLLRISARLLRREELSNEVLASLRMLLIIRKKDVIRKLSRQVAFGIHDLLRTNAANIQSNDDWANIFTILQVYGAGASPPLFDMEKQVLLSKSPSTKFNEMKTLSNEDLNSNAPSESTVDRGYTSDSEIYQSQSTDSTISPKMVSAISDQALNRDLMETSIRSNQSGMANQYKIDLDDVGLDQHDKKAFAKCCETLNFLIRDMAYVSFRNFESCIHCLRTFVEACVQGDRSKNEPKKDIKKPTQNKRLTKTTKTDQNLKRQEDSDDEEDQFVTSYETISLQLLDLLDTLHIKAASIFTHWAEEQRHIFQQSSKAVDSVVSNLWAKCWCPILQGIARLSCDTNGEVRMHALQYLQRALLVHELQTLSAMEWEACFNKVLFPLLAKLLENIDPRNSVRMEETRMRASTLLCKVFLQHLTTLARLSTFTALWLTILDYMDKYMKSDKSDLLHDVIPESLKNMLLVMETTGLFNQTNADAKFSSLCAITKDRIESFLPGLWQDLFRVNSAPPSVQTEQVPLTIQTPSTEIKEDLDNKDVKCEQPEREADKFVEETASLENSSPKLSKSASEIKDI
ncbi:unnamed protein product [Brachionus calyciflorus]|uniref:SEC7 domain-containing protein n=1 Tax=Brachionus calyciflorus TaxID=104777 RepID=A0A813Y4I6_9BILA|nr:unnamed protein product [Brachionus calyciflorus]